MKIRYESSDDEGAVWNINRQAFPTNVEANLVNELRSKTKCISLVAEDESQTIGHILFSPVTIEGGKDLSVLGLAPMAVLPREQNRGVGSLLVEKGIEECKAIKCDAIVVLGHPNYYPRFGFHVAKKFNIKSEFEVPDEVFMIQELTLESLSNVSGVIRYHDAFNNV